MFPRTMLAMIALLALLGLALRVSAQDVSDAEAQEFQRIISSQIKAFNADDGAAAYAHAAPLIQRLFPSPEIFLSMVKRGYAPVYRQRSYSFGPIGNELGGRPTQHVTIVDANGKLWTALYAMERQPDGSWKISACTLVEAPAADA